MAETRTRTRDAEATKARILTAAKAEFARLGLGGARVDVIAERAAANKRMIYHYFGSKEDLFAAVLEDVYMGFRTAEQALDLKGIPADEAMARLIRFTWDYYLKNPEFIRLVNSANLHEGKHLERSTLLQDASRAHLDLADTLLKRGVREGLFREGVDAVQLNITIAAIGYYYLTNRFTGEILFERDYMSPEALEERLAFNIDTIMRLVRRPDQSPR